MAEITDRCFYMVQVENGRTQLNIPRNYFYGEIDVDINEPRIVNRGGGNIANIEEAARLISEAKNPVIISGGGVIMSFAVDEIVKCRVFGSSCCK